MADDKMACERCGTLHHWHHFAEPAPGEKLLCDECIEQERALAERRCES